MIDLGNRNYGLSDTLIDHDINIYTLQAGPPILPVDPVPTNLVDIIEFRIDTADGAIYELEKFTGLASDPDEWESTGALIQGNGEIMRMYEKIAPGNSGYNRVRFGAP